MQLSQNYRFSTNTVSDLQKAYVSPSSHATLISCSYAARLYSAAQQPEGLATRPDYLPA